MKFSYLSIESIMVAGQLSDDAANRLSTRGSLLHGNRNKILGIPTHCSTSPKTETTNQVSERAWEAATVVVRLVSGLHAAVIVSTKELVY